MDSISSNAHWIAYPKAALTDIPPYNIEQIGENGLRITLAVAGFSSDELTVTVEDTQLVIRGKQTDDADRVFLHRGIAARQFQRSFVLADGIEVEGADLSSGLLHVDLKRPVPESRQRVIEIRSDSETQKPTAKTIDLHADREAS